MTTPELPHSTKYHQIMQTLDLMERTSADEEDREAYTLLAQAAGEEFRASRHEKEEKSALPIRKPE